MKHRAICLTAIFAVACGGAQAKRAEEPTPTASPAYTTGGAAPQDQHTMPDSTTMSGHEGMHHGGQHVMPDGGVMEGQGHSQGGSHVMPDGTVMPGNQHGGTK